MPILNPLDALIASATAPHRRKGAVDANMMPFNPAVAQRELQPLPFNPSTKLRTQLLSSAPTPQFQGGSDIVEAARARLQQAQSQQANAAQMMAVKRAMAKMAHQAAQSLDSMYGGNSSGGSSSGGYISPKGLPAPSGDLRHWIHRALVETGHTGEGLRRGLANMIQHESGGNPHAINNWDSNAAAGTPSMGLMQTILPTFNAYAMKGHRNVYNPVDNIIAGLRYALSRYGAGMVRAGGRHDANGNYLGY